MLHRSAGQNQWTVGSATATVRASASLESLKPKSFKTPRHIAWHTTPGDMADTAHWFCRLRYDWLKTSQINVYRKITLAGGRPWWICRESGVDRCTSGLRHRRLARRGVAACKRGLRPFLRLSPVAAADGRPEATILSDLLVSGFYDLQPLNV